MVREKEREIEREKEKDWEREEGRERKREKERERVREREREKERERDAYLFASKKRNDLAHSSDSCHPCYLHTWKVYQIIHILP